MNLSTDEIVSKRIICTPSPSAKNAFFYAQETGITVNNDSDDTARHDLESLLYAVVLEGRGVLGFGDTVYKLSKGDCFFIDCRVPHYYKSNEDDPWKLMWIHFNGATSKQYYETFVSQSKNVFRPVPIDKVTEALSEIIDRSESKTLNDEAIISGLIVRLLTIALTSAEGTEQVDSALKQKLQAVNLFIEKHFTEDLSLERLSSEFYISKYYLSREYKKIYGKTIFRHIINCRINYGKHLLRFSDNSVEEIAHLCGFNDQSYFVRQFKKTENLTCFAYRKKWR